MTSDERLNQLELLLAETMAVLDQHTGLHRQTQAQIKQIIGLIGQQSSNIEFLLTAVAELRTIVASVQKEQAEMRGSMAEMRGSMAEMRGSMAEMRAEIRAEQAEIRAEQAEIRGSIVAVQNSLAEVRQDILQFGQNQNELRTEFSGKLDLVLQLLQNSNR
jgi:chromosome segregation ATPase